MGSWAEILVLATNGEDFCHWAVAEVERREACWSRFRVSSELSALNRNAGAGATVVSSSLYGAVESAAMAWRNTKGLFDPTVLHALMDLGYDRDLRKGPGPVPQTQRTVPGFAGVTLDPHAKTIELPAGTALDLGGIGKGLAADAVVVGLCERGAMSACVSMGGDLRVAGTGPDADGAWLVPVEDPRSDRVVSVIPMRDRAIAQSTVALRYWYQGSQRRHHLIDPRTSAPCENAIVSAIVAAADTATADVFAKAALIAGPRAGVELLEEAGLDGWLLLADFGVISTSNVTSGDFACSAN